MRPTRAADARRRRRDRARDAPSRRGGSIDRRRTAEQRRKARRWGCSGRRRCCDGRAAADRTAASRDPAARVCARSCARPRAHVANRHRAERSGAEPANSRIGFQTGTIERPSRETREGEGKLPSRRSRWSRRASRLGRSQEGSAATKRILQRGYVLSGFGRATAILRPASMERGGGAGNRAQRSVPETEALRPAVAFGMRVYLERRRRRLRARRRNLGVSTSWWIRGERTPRARPSSTPQGARKADGRSRSAASRAPARRGCMRDIELRWAGTGHAHPDARSRCASAGSANVARA